MRPARHSFTLLLRIAALALGFLPGSALLLQGQEIWLGPVADVARRHHSTSLPVFSASSAACGLFESGWETAAALGGQISLTPPAGGHLGLTGRLTFSPSTGLLTTDAPEPFTFHESGGSGSGEVRRAEHEYRLEIKMLELRLHLLLDWNLTDRLRLHAGPSVGYVLDITTNQSDYITDPIYRFDGGAREQQIARQDFLAAQTLLIGGQAGISYKIPLGGAVLFIPEVTVKTDFTPLFQQASRLSWGPGVGFSVLTRLSDGEEEREDRLAEDIPPPDTTAPQPLRASIALRGTNDEGESLSRARVRVYETLRRNPATGAWEAEHRPAPPVLVVEPEFVSPWGIAEWEVTFGYNGQVIGRSSSRDDAPPASFNWKVPDRPDSDTAGELTATLKVTDSTGAAVTATDRIPLRIERLSRVVDDRGESILYTLYPVREKSAEAMRENNRALREAAAAAAEGGNIRVVRLVEKSLSALPSGSPEQRLMEEEAAAVAERLRTILQEEEGKAVPITVGLQSLETFYREGVPTDRTPHPEIQIIVERP